MNSRAIGSIFTSKAATSQTPSPQSKTWRLDDHPLDNAAASWSAGTKSAESPLCDGPPPKEWWLLACFCSLLWAPLSSQAAVTLNQPPNVDVNYGTASYSVNLGGIGYSTAALYDKSFNQTIFTLPAKANTYDGFRVASTGRAVKNFKASFDFYIVTANARGDGDGFAFVYGSASEVDGWWDNTNRPEPFEDAGGIALAAGLDLLGGDRVWARTGSSAKQHNSTTLDIKEEVWVPVAAELSGGQFKITIDGRTASVPVGSLSPGTDWKFAIGARNGADYAEVRFRNLKLQELPDPSETTPKLFVSVASSNQSVFQVDQPNYLGGASTAFALRSQTGIRDGGTSTITVTVSTEDNKGSISKSFTATLKPAPVPNLNTIENIIHQEGVNTNRVFTVDLTGISDGNELGDAPISITASSSKPAVADNPRVNYASPAPNGTLTITVKPGPYPGGRDESTITVTINNGAKNFTKSFKVIAYDAPVPTLSAIVNQNVDEDVPETRVTLEGISTGDPLRSVILISEAVSDNPIVVPHPRISYNQSPSSTATLSFQPSANQSGTAKITVTFAATADTYPEHYQPKAKVTKEFTITVRPVQDAVVAGATAGVRFDGRDNRLEIARFSTLGLTGDATFEFWQKVTAAPDSRNFTFRLREERAGDKASENYVRTNKVEVQTPGANGKVTWAYGKSRMEMDFGRLDGLLNSWVHWAFVVSTNEGAMRIYKDGLLQAEQSAATSLTSPVYAVGFGQAAEQKVSNHKLSIGEFQGDLAELRIWNFARSESEIRQTKDQPLTGDEGGLLAYYRFLEGTGVVASDNAPGEAQAFSQPADLVNGTQWIRPGDLRLVDASTQGAFRFVRTISEGSLTNAIVLPAFDPDVLYNDNYGDATNPVGDQLTFTVITNGLHGKMVGRPESSTWFYTPGNQFNGRETIRYTVKDSRNNSSDGILELVVLARNDPPSVSTIAGQTVFENSGLTIPFTVMDPDTPPEFAKLTVVSTDRTVIKESGLSLRQSGTNWTLTLKPELGESGFSQVRITSFDGQDAKTQTFEVQVRPRPAYAPMDLGELAGRPITEAVSINERGEVVGWAAQDASGTAPRGFYYNGLEKGGLMFQVPTFDTSGGGFSRALGINADGDMTGVASFNDGRYKAFKWRFGQDLPTDVGAISGGNVSVGYAINQLGDIAGTSATSGNGSPSAFVRQGSSNNRINSLPSPYNGTNVAVAVNDSGLVVGTSLGSGGQKRAYYYDGVQDPNPQPLGRLAAVSSSVHTNTTAAALNSAGVVAGTYVRARSPYGKILTLDGVNGQLISSGGPLTLNNTNQTFTIELWLQRTGIRTNEIFLSQGPELQLGFDGANRLFARCGGSVFTGAVVNDQVWHNVALVFDGLAGDRQLFLDGALAARDAITGRHTSSGPVTLGAGVGDRFKGSLDEVRIWNGARTALQIRNGQYGWAGDIEPGLLARWNFDNDTLDDGNLIKSATSVYTTDINAPTGSAPASRGNTNPYRLALEPTRLTGTGTGATNVAVVGNRVYVAEGTPGIEIFESSTSGGLRRVGGFNTAGSASSVAAVGNRVLVADGSNGLVTLDTAQADNPTLVNTYQSTSGAITSVKVSGNIAVVTANKTIELLDVKEVVTSRYTTNLVEIGRANNTATVFGVNTNAAAVLDNNLTTIISAPFSTLRESGLLLAVTNQLAIDQLRLVAAPSTTNRAAIRGFRLLGGKSTNAAEFTLLAEGEFPAPNGTNAVSLSVKAPTAYPAYKFVVTSVHSDTATQFGLAELDLLREELTAQTGGTVTRLASIPLTEAELATGALPDLEVDGTTGYIVGGRGVVQTVSLDPNRPGLTLSNEPVRLNIVSAPAISTQPASWTNSVGGSATFRSEASGDGITYQWRKDGVAISGATGQVYIQGNLVSGDAGKYSVAVSNSSGTVTSSDATLTVTAAASATTTTTPVGTESTEALGKAVDAAGTSFIALAPLPSGTGWSEVTGTSYDTDGKSLTAGGKVGGQPVIGDSQSRSMSLSVTGPGSIRFAWKVSSESGYDKLSVSLDTTEQESISGEIDWVVKTVQIASGSHTLAWTYGKDGSLAGGSDQAWVDAIELLQGATAVNQAAWRTGGNAAWTSQTGTTKDGVDAAASGNIDHNQESWMETIVEGPGTLSFQWKVSSETCCDALRLSVDGLQQDLILGDVNWTLKTIEVGTGRHTVRWAYTKDSSAVAGSDKAWVDQVTFVSTLSLKFAQQPSGTAFKPGGSVTLSGGVASASSYSLISGSRTWAEAKTHAQTQGGNLAAITSDTKWKDVLRQVPLADLFNARAWIGLTDETTEGTYKWVNGESMSYSRWNAGEPNNARADGPAGEDYVQIATSDGLWNDASAGAKASGYLLEKPFAITYQWQRDGVNLAGATNATLTLTNAQIAQAGGYRLIAQDSRGTVSSDSAVVNFTTPPPVVATATGPIGLEVRIFNDNRYVDTSAGVSGELTNVWSSLASLGFQPVGFFGTNFGTAKVVVVPKLELGVPSLSTAEAAAWSNYVARGNALIAMDASAALWLNTFLGTSLAVKTSVDSSGGISRGADAAGTAFADDPVTLGELTPAPSSRDVSTLAGSGSSGFADGIGTSAQFYSPYGVAVDAAETFMWQIPATTAFGRSAPPGWLVRWPAAPWLVVLLTAQATVRSLITLPEWRWTAPEMFMWLILTTTAYGRLHRSEW